MQRSNRLEAIQEGKFLSLQSDISVESPAELHNARERPFVIPQHDPQRSIYTSRYSKDLASTFQASELSYSTSQIINGSMGYDGKIPTEPQKTRSRLPTPAPRCKLETAGLPSSPANPPPSMSPRPRPPRPSAMRERRSAMRISRLSITPSIVAAGCLPPDQTYRRNADMSGTISSEPGKIPPMHIVKLPGEKSDLEPPDGGTLAWLMVLAGFFVIMDAQGLNQSYGVFQAYYESVLLRTHSPSSIAWIGSLQIFLLFFMSIVVSSQMDKGRFHHCFTGGSILLTSSVLVTSWCKVYWHYLLAQGIGTGIGMGLVFGAGAQVLFTYFSKHLGIATGVASAGGAVGGMVFPAICEKLITKIGFAWTVRVVALVVLVTLIPANLIARERPGSQNRKKPQMDWSAFTDVPYLLVTAGLFFTFWGVYFGFYFIVTFAQETLNLSPTEATNLLILMNAANLPGRFLPPLISDSCLGPLNTLIPCTFLTSTLLFLWLGSSTSTSIHLLACFYGFAAAGIQSLYNAAVWGVVRVPIAEASPKASSASVSGSGSGSVSSVVGLRKELGGGEDYDEEDGDSDLDKVTKEGVGFDEGKARLRLAMVFVMIGVACLT
ncbi:MAG: hypothetical protein Q9188_007614, partial [Gyalolechia gomerana]